MLWSWAFSAVPVCLSGTSRFEEVLRQPHHPSLVHSPMEYLWRLVSGLEKGSVYFSLEGDAGGWPAVKTSLMWCPYFPPLIISSHSFLNIFYAPLYLPFPPPIASFSVSSSVAFCLVSSIHGCLLSLPAFVLSFISSWWIPLRCAVFAPPLPRPEHCVNLSTWILKDPIFRCFSPRYDRHVRGPARWSPTMLTHVCNKEETRTPSASPDLSSPHYAIW